MKMIHRFLIPSIAATFLLSSAQAGRPVYHTVSLIELAGKSPLIITGYPSPGKPEDPCPTKLGMWQVHHVLKGDRSLEGKRLAIAGHKNELTQSFKKGTPGASFAADLYAQKNIDFDTKTSLLFLDPKKQGCNELSAVGAQENAFQETLIASIAVGPHDCDLQLQAFQGLVDKLPGDCKGDSDCQPFLIHPNSCERAIPLNKSAQEMLKDDWLTHMARIRSACAKTWVGQPACSIAVAPVRCRAYRCAIGFPPSTKPEFSRATWSASCAPHDAPSVSITFKTAKKDYPVLGINWWGGKAPGTQHHGGNLPSEFDRF